VCLLRGTHLSFQCNFYYVKGAETAYGRHLRTKEQIHYIYGHFLLSSNVFSPKGMAVTEGPYVQ
jgi:hypothetical protein